MKRLLLGSILATGLLAAPTQAATISVADATVTSHTPTNFVNADATGQVGRNGGNSVNFRAYAAFSVSDILTNESLTLGQLAATSFTLSFDASEDQKTLGAGSYRVDYVGFFANGDFPDIGAGSGLGQWDDANGAYNTGEEVDTGVADTTASQTGITAFSFILAGVTEADTANDMVVFGVRYSEPQAAGLDQALSNYSLTLVPEPASLALLGLGGLLMLRRRRVA